jgi:uncharacterized protein YfaS (alpha-2-macroglobulin family)
LRPSSVTLSFTTFQYEIRYRVSPAIVVWGDKVTHEVIVSNPRTGERVADVEVRFQWYVAGAWRTIATVRTNSVGVATFTWTVPFRFQIAPDRSETLPCGSYSTRAFIPSTGQASTTVTVKVAYPTKITASTNKASYAPGETVIITGRLTRVEETGEAPLAGKTVTITWWDGSTTNVTTDASGNFTASKQGPTTAGTFRITVSFLGEGWGYTPSVQTLGFGLGGSGAASWAVLALASLGLLGLAYAKKKRVI